MSTYVVGVSGGVDSVVLLDQLTRIPGHEIIVAHFDHGIREDSAEDALFVAGLAEVYGLPFETVREELGAEASEEKARDRRYAFLRSMAEKYNGRIVTAHHSDDAVETIAINLHRGTGWRGLAVLDSDISRPLLHSTKADHIEYARRRDLTWREDSTNASDAYLRNRLRRDIVALTPDQKQQLLALRAHQVDAKKQIDKEVATLVGEGPEYSRYFFTHIPMNVAIECLRYITKAQLTRPQLERLLFVIKTAQSKSLYHAGSSVTVDFTTRNFSLSLLK